MHVRIHVENSYTYTTSTLSSNRLVTCLPGYIRRGRDPSFIICVILLTHPINPKLHNIQDVGYYAHCGPNLSKLCATCLFLRVTDLDEATFIYLRYHPW
jgi:hypothetical protein